MERSYDLLYIHELVQRHIKHLLNSWKKNIDTKNLDGIVNSYSQGAILLATFSENIIFGSNAIRNYFDNLFKKQNLSVEFINPKFIQKFKKVFIVAGTYNFTYTENDIKKIVKADIHLY